MQVVTPPVELEEGVIYGVWEGVPTYAMRMCFSLCCEVVSRLQFGALDGWGRGETWGCVVVGLSV